MKRIKIAPRNNWQKKVEEIGFSYHTINSVYWDESVCYEFSSNEINQIEKATNVLWELCVDAVQFVIDNKLYDKFHIPNWVVPHIENSWENDDPSIYGRFDFSFENGIPKLLEFNADTPTSLFESAVVQWYWLQDFDASKDQFNSIHEKLVDYWKYLKDYLHPSALYFSCVKDNMEDITNTEYLRDCAIQGGLLTKFVYMDEIGWDEYNSCFVDDVDKPIENIFKLYPYEWMLNEQFGRNIIQDRRKAYWIEPSWKMILSNKAILPILWKLNPGHENLLEAYFEQDKFMLNNSYARKPLLSREGANVQLLNYGSVITETNGEYGSEGYVYQKFCPLPNFEGNFPLVGSWVVGQESVGIGIRESQNLITDNLSKFVPHLIVD
jgi:glutathionylspermidine synthase